IMERVINDSLLQHLSSSPIHPSQHGFISRRSCITCEISFLNLVTLSVDKGKSTIIIYLDMTKAFDRVPHERLLLKLTQAGIGNPLHGWIRSFLSSRNERVHINDIMTPCLPITSGVIQGSVLGPALFLTYVNDIIPCFSGTPFLFADDCKVVYSFDSKDIQSQISIISQDIRRLEAWCENWQMKFNAEKCYLLAHRCSIPPATLLLNGTPIKAAETIRDLGFYYSATLNFSEHINKQILSCTRLSYLINNSFSNIQAKILLFKTCALPIIDYGSFIISSARKTDAKKIESVQRTFTRKLLSDQNLTYRERCILLRLDPLWLRRLKLNLTCIYKLFLSSSTILSEFLHTPTYSLRNLNRKLYPHPAHCTIRANFFLVRYSTIWNNLPSAIRNSPNALIFRRSLDSLLTPEKAAELLCTQVNLDALFSDGPNNI
ncbi:MAG: RNA-directed DNA polymerase, partial [Aeromonas sp.]